MTGTKFMGYRRENGSVGVRNRVVILPLDDLSNAAAEGVAKLIDGTIALPHPYGRLQFGEDLELFFRTLIGTGSNPNVAACIVIGIEPNWTNRVVEGIAKTGKPVAGFAIERYGDLKVIEMASRKAIEFVQYATELQKEECDISELVVSIKCGESDTTSGLASNPSIGNAVDRLIDMGATVLFGETSELTGGEHLVAARCATPEIREQFMQSFKSYSDFIISQGVDLCGSQPTEGNIAGGLTTIEEKALGNIQKIGKRALIQGVLQPAEAPKGKGLWYMETSSAGAEAVTLFAAGGSVLHFFTTGQGNIVGNPIIPVIKISANPVTVSTMSEHIDVDLTGLLRREMDLDGAGTAILDMFIRTLNGRYTCAEALNHKEFILTKLYRSA
ncbi:galactarate dehydratase [Moorella sp. E308F]|uniref:UxaA family hydrolase n=1 Tax=Moorella sp. E308F TaxID=2572682 RepID=UPI0010FFBAB0|nr:UxaA family hydrolase [Moorella sp. E308F]GEA15929.1 galactarate dehydratase [Moorella sp. E308F]